MSEQPHIPGSEQGPQQLTATEVIKMSEQLHMSVPKNVAEANQMVETAREAALELTLHLGEGEFREPDAEAAAMNVMHAAQDGSGYWRLASGARSEAHQAANAKRPSDLDEGMLQHLRALKTDPAESDAKALPALRADMRARLKIDQKIAAAAGEEVAPFTPDYQAKLDGQAAARQAKEAARPAEAEKKALEKARAEALDRVAEFIKDPESEFASGADIKRATGLSAEDMWKLRFGSFTEMKKAAAELNAQREEAQRQNIEERRAKVTQQRADRAEQQRVDAYRAKGQAQADAWNTERDQYRAEREQQRVEHEAAEAARYESELTAASADRAKAIESRMRLNRGGIYLDKHPEEAQQIHEDALAQARQETLAAGFTMTPAPVERTGMIVPTNDAAVARANAMGALLRAQQSGRAAEPEETHTAYRGTAKVVNTGEDDSTSGDDENNVPIWQLPPRRRPVVDPDDPENDENAWSDDDWSPEEDEDRVPLDDLLELEPRPLNEDEAVSRLRPLKPLSPLKRAQYAANTAIQSAFTGSERLRDWFNDTERGGERANRRRVIAALGAVAVALTAAAALKWGIHTGGASRSAAESAVDAHPTAGASPSPDVLASNAPGGSGASGNTVTQFTEVTLPDSGGANHADTIWGQLKISHPDANDRQLWHMMQQTLSANGMSMDDATKIHGGAKIKIVK